jgi:hypothetical protein
MYTDAKTAVWIMEAEVGEDEYIYVCSDHMPTEQEISLMKLTVLKVHRNVPMRILPPEEVVKIKLEVVQHEFVEWCDPCRLRLMENKRACVIN